MVVSTSVLAIGMVVSMSVLAIGMVVSTSVLAIGMVLFSVFVLIGSRVETKSFSTELMISISLSGDCVTVLEVFLEDLRLRELLIVVVVDLLLLVMEEDITSYYNQRHLNS